MVFRPFLFLVVMALAVTGPAAPAQEGEKDPKKLSIAELKEQAKPGPEHDLLEKFMGKWDVTVTMSRGRQSASSKGGGNSYMTLERRFLWLQYGTAGKAGKFKGAFLIGFDRRHGHFTLIGLDTHGTYYVSSKGKKDPESGKIKLYGQDDDPHMKAMGFAKEFVHVLDLQDPAKLTLEVFYIDTRAKERKENKAIEYVFKRKE